MAGIGVKLNQIFEKNALTTNLAGFGYSTSIFIAPMVFVLLAVFAMQSLLEYATVGYADRALFSCTILYVFIFALLISSPFNAVLSKYMSNVIYEETYGDILPCYYVGLVLNVLFAGIAGISFCAWEFLAGGVALEYVLAGYGAFIALVLVFYSMLYLSVCRAYKKIFFFFLFGMAAAVLMAYLFAEIGKLDVTLSMLFGLDGGLFLIASMEYAGVRGYFCENSGRYKEVWQFFKKCPKLMFANFLYILGMYIHNFIFWVSDMHIVVAKSFVSVPAYDLATCIAMFTNISASVIFIARIETHFNQRYKAYSEAVTGGRGMDIEITKKRLFRSLSEELMNLVRVQFIISVILFFACMVLMPGFGFGGRVLKIYPCLAAGYFVLFIMYAAVIFLYYFNDMTGALQTTAAFCAMTAVGSVVSSHLPLIWYGAGLLFGAFLGWGVAYARLQWLEKNMNEYIFCEGHLLESGKGRRPAGKVYDRSEVEKRENKERKRQEKNLKKYKKPKEKPQKKSKKK